MFFAPKCTTKDVYIGFRGLALCHGIGPYLVFASHDREARAEECSQRVPKNDSGFEEYSRRVPNRDSSLDERSQGASPRDLRGFATVAVGAVDSDQSIDDDGWLRFTYDTGAAVTAFPSDFGLGTRTPASDATYKTASGEIIEDAGGLKLEGRAEGGRAIRLTGRLADVHKVLVAASAVHKQGHTTVLYQGGGAIIPGGSRLAR